MRHHIGLLGDVCEHLSGAHSPVARSAAVKANERAGLKGIWFPLRGRKGGCHQPAPPAAILSSEFFPSTSARTERRMFPIFWQAAELPNVTEMGRKPQQSGEITTIIHYLLVPNLLLPLWRAENGCLDLH
uniref:Uncharacterized protein n=1 Tax=Branchiostoma floridae TaxID=7739 RepID=C3XYM3_BRAFL|eukprot:XP_002610898.1 hypothetical protein BRAFLDRAFT_91494 [Branchiostoma floridae]